jgi:hypothetical protein
MASAPVNNASLEGIEPLRTGNIELGWDRARQRLVVFIDCAPASLSAARPSKSGKTLLLASTRGFQPVPYIGGTTDDIRLQLNLTISEQFRDDAVRAEHLGRKYAPKRKG